jgi:hypothetical protein
MPSLTLSTSASEILPSNASRKSFVIQNESTADSVYIKKERAETTSVSSTDHDLLLGPGASMALNTANDGAKAIQGRWTGVASANTPRISWFETEDILR